jgi:hypothetical protein
MAATTTTIRIKTATKQRLAAHARTRGLKVPEFLDLLTRRYEDDALWRETSDAYAEPGNRALARTAGAFVHATRRRLRAL